MRIVYEKIDKSVVVLIPTQEALAFATLSQIAEKDVPHQLPYWIVEDTEIPTDRTMRDAWIVDPAWGDPHGFGGLNNEFDAQLLASWKGL